jgi:two-component system response regulator WspF
MRIAIANDLPISVEALRRVITTTPGYELAWIAHNGAEAVAKCAVDRPDLILMDLVMPVMDGVEATHRIMSQFPCAILLVTASVNGLAPKVFEAMGYGALDAVRTPSWQTGQTEGSLRLLAKIATIAKLIDKSPRHRSHRPPFCPVKFLTPPLPPLIVIGASTGGPHALAQVLSQFPADLGTAVVIVQHVDAQFAPGFVDWLNCQIPMTVELADSHCRPEAGKILVAGTTDHLVMRTNLSLGHTAQPQNHPYRPSIDVFFKSVAERWPQPGTGILLTGMGRDGAAGLAQLRMAGWHTIAQDQASSIVYGMPKAAAELDAATEILSIDAIAAACLKRLRYHQCR